MTTAADRARAERIRESIVAVELRSLVKSWPDRHASMADRRAWRAKLAALTERLDGRRSAPDDLLQPAPDDDAPDAPFLPWVASTGGRHSASAAGGVIARVKPTGVGNRYAWELHTAARLVASGTARSAEAAKAAADSAHRRHRARAQTSAARRQRDDWHDDGRSWIDLRDR